MAGFVGLIGLVGLVLTLKTSNGLRVVDMNVVVVVTVVVVVVVVVVDVGLLTTLLSSRTQHDPNMNPSLHMPKCCPLAFMHSHTNMQCPSLPDTLHEFGIMSYPSEKQ